MAAKADQTDVDAELANLEFADANPVLPTNSSEPYTCEAADAGAIVLTARFSTCVCNGTDWVSAAEGITSCEWYGIVTSAGQVWMDRNLGASRVATSPTDSAAYGDLYQWGRGTDGHQIRTSGTTSTLSTSDNPGHGDFITTSQLGDWRSPQNDNLWQGVTGINNPCPDGFRLPTEIEWNNEISSWSSATYQGSLESPLILVKGGARQNQTGEIFVNTLGYYWSSTVDGGYSTFFYINSGTGIVDTSSGSRSTGMSVRCLQD